MFSSNARPSLRNSSLHSATSALAAVISSRHEIIGNNSRTFPVAPARRIARSWVLNNSCRDSDTRIPRHPRNGFDSSSP